MTFSPGDPGYLIAAYAFLIICSGMLCKFLYDLYKAISSITWNKTPATILVHSTDESIDDDRNVSHKPKVRYNYKYLGEGYLATRVSYRELHFSTREKAMNRIYALSERGKFYARVNPNNPQQSVLLTGPDFLNYGAIAIALLGIYLAIKGISAHNALLVG